MPLLAVDNLAVQIGGARILGGISLAAEAGSILAVVGESGSGKTMTALAIMRLLPAGAVASGRVALGGEELTALSEAEVTSRRGRALGMIFQEPMTALNPLKTIGAQVAETVLVHHRASRTDAMAMAAEALDRVGLPQSRVPLDRYPHELSGGERQRVVIAIATVLRPPLIIADEPTSALDVASQAVVLTLLRRLVAEDGATLVLISHDLAAVAGMADRLVVMRKGTIVEAGEAPTIFRSLRHPYSRALLAAATYRRTRPERTRSSDDRQPPLLQVERIIREYGVPFGVPAGAIPRRPAVNDVSFTIRRGENVALVGESGSGKSTLARVILALDRPRSGRVLLNGSDLHAARGTALRDLRRHIQVVFQDPYASFDPRAKVWRSIAEPLVLDPAKPAAGERRRRVDESLLAVGLQPGHGDKYPHEFSGGERQRLAIARALITRPSLIVLDEPVSALDVSIRGEVLDLLASIADRFGVSYLFISHDLAVVRAIADRVLVMREGRIVEEGPTEEIFARPRDAYTAALVAAIPDLESSLVARGSLSRRV
jgi:peptide/nickel transport system ATP-binding protein